MLSNGSLNSSRRYSQIIAENILESPNERDFVDNKNYHVYLELEKLKTNMFQGTFNCLKE